MSHKADGEGARTLEQVRKAEGQQVDEGDIRFEDEG